jgi:hypothetical protein
MRRLLFVTFALLFLLGTAGAASAQGHIIIFNNNAPNVGFNDPAPAAPVGGNTGTTRGQQRLNVFNRAAAIWEAKLLPKTDIHVLSDFAALGPNVLGSAGTLFVFANFPGAELLNTWYPSALANQLAGVDLQPCPPGPLTFACFDIQARFSSQFDFYLGFDNNDGPGQADLLAVVLHELGHGLGFANFVNETTGTLLQNLPDVYSEYTLDVQTNKIWNDMTNAERQASAINVRKVSWSGITVNKDVPAVLAPGEPSLVVLSPAALGAFPIGTASFGAPLNAAGVSGDVVVGLDAADLAGPSTTDGCSPLTNAGAVVGKIALLDRGTCGFVVKVKNAQDAGAKAVLIADNVQSSPPAGLGGTDPAITITSARVALSDGNAIKAALTSVGSVTVKLSLDMSILAGTDRVKHLMMLAAFNPVIGGSSISHFEGVAFPNQLMEPAINPDLTSSVEPPQDLTLSLLTDIGWFSDNDGVPDGVDACLRSDIRPTVVIGDCNSGVANRMFTDGCSMSDVLARCAVGARNHGDYVSCVAQTTNEFKNIGAIDGSGKGAIQSCAAKKK